MISDMTKYKILNRSLKKIDIEVLKYIRYFYLKNEARELSFNKVLKVLERFKIEHKKEFNLNEKELISSVIKLRKASFASISGINLFSPSMESIIYITSEDSELIDNILFENHELKVTSHLLFYLYDRFDINKISIHSYESVSQSWEKYKNNPALYTKFKNLSQDWLLVEESINYSGRNGNRVNFIFTKLGVIIAKMIKFRGLRSTEKELMYDLHDYPIKIRDKHLNHYKEQLILSKDRYSAL